jgi:hypothetical protein
VSRQDPKGYYKVLRVPPTASADELRRAFRALAMECHPDKNPDLGATAQFRLLSEAYGVLADAKTRAMYDGRPYVSAAEREFGGRRAQDRRQAGEAAAYAASAATEAGEPIYCDGCARPTAQPRETAFWTVISVGFSWRSQSRGVYCAACAAQVGLRCSAITAAFGWWGPLGLLWTPLSILRNARGGERDEEADAALLWHNAVAFKAQGKPAVAHALARQVAAAKSPYALDAADLIGDLHRAGVPRDTPPLVDPWKGGAGSAAGQALMALAAPAVVASAIYFYGLPTGALATPAYASALGPMMPAPISAATAAGAERARARAPAPAATCMRAPADGELMEGELPLGGFGHRLEIRNGADGPTIVKVRDAETGHVRLAFVVSQGGHAEVGPLPDGAFRIQYAVGPTLAPDCRSLSAIDSAVEFPQTETLTREYRDGSVLTQRLSYALRSTPESGGKLQTIDRSKFLAE